MTHTVEHGIEHDMTTTVREAVKETEHEVIDGMPEDVVNSEQDGQWQEVSPSKVGRHLELSGGTRLLESSNSPSRFSILEATEEEVDGEEQKESREGEIIEVEKVDSTKKIEEKVSRPSLPRAKKGVNTRNMISYVVSAKETNPSASGKRGSTKNH